MEALTPILKSEPESAGLISSQVAPALQKLTSDGDVDVKWFAERALLAGMYEVLKYEGARLTKILLIVLFLVPEPAQ